ncbi:MAG TPA: RsmD family RNA methyltransferase, partial [Polyangia bacterium]|nr:RsmD family RNA methyltransferase [Polyangia bacterium]
MRLTGGTDRGRRLVTPRGHRTRPTGAKVREAMFNILGPPPEGAVLDLFAGTGALGLEALSRGAARAVFVER